MMTKTKRIENVILTGDCLVESDKIASGSVDLILTDLPYGTMNGFNGIEWDFAIDPKEVYAIASRILRKNGKLVLFSQEPYTSKLITEANPSVPFSYRAIWEKDNFANALLVNKAMAGYFEDILVFSKSYEVGKDIIPDNPVYHYLQECRLKSGMSIKDYNYLYSDYVGKTKNRHRGMVARCWETSQFWVPSKDIYENVLQPTGYFPMSYEVMKEVDENYKRDFLSTFNLWEGGKYKSNILRYKKDYDGFHPTQKPVLLLEDLIKTFSNAGDTVVDLTAGSGSTAVAAINSGRNFVAIEQDADYVAIAQRRIDEAKAAQVASK